jgi:hypothetical protein
VRKKSGVACLIKRYLLGNNLSVTCYCQVTCPWRVTGKWRVPDMLLGNDMLVGSDVSLTCYWEVTKASLIKRPSLLCAAISGKKTRLIFGLIWRYTTFPVIVIEQFLKCFIKFYFPSCDATVLGIRTLKINPLKTKRVCFI